MPSARQAASVCARVTSSSGRRKTLERRAACRPATGRPSRGPARAARSRPGRRGCGRAARRARRSARRPRSSTAYRASRAAASGPCPAPSTSTRTDDGLVGARARPSARRPASACSAEPSCRPWSTVTPTTAPGRARAPRRRSAASRASESAPPEQATSTGPPASRSASAAAYGEPDRGDGGVEASRRLSRARGATQAAGSAISALDGQVRGLGPDGVEVRPCRPCRRRARTKAAPSRYCAILASRPSSRRSSRSSDADALAALVELARGSRRRDGITSGRRRPSPRRRGPRAATSRR